MYVTILLNRIVATGLFFYIMRKFLLNISILCLFLFCFNFNIVFAIEEVNENAILMEKETINKVTGEISFDEISQKAKEHSYDIRLADFDIMITKQGIRDARSEYFPKLSAMATTEYTKNFSDYPAQSVTTVGESFINPYTRFQSLFGVTLSYNLFDFGIRRNTLDIAKEDTAIKELVLKSVFQDLDLTLIDTYCKLLLTKKQIDINNEILKLAQDNLEMKERLLNAKEISKTDINDQKIKVQAIQQKLADLNSMAAESLSWLSFYTGENYDLDSITVLDFNKPDFDPMEFNDYTKSVVWQIQEKELKKKELELRIAKKNYLPKLNAYGRYYLYGSDHSSYNDALDNISPSNYTVGGSILMPLFDGFKTSAAVQKASLELKKQLVERDKSIAEFMNKLSIMRSNLFFMEKQANANKEALDELIKKEKSQKRLLDKKVITPMEWNETRIELLQQKIEYEKNAVTFIAILKGIQTLTTY